MGKASLLQALITHFKSCNNSKTKSQVILLKLVHELLFYKYLKNEYHQVYLCIDLQYL